MKFTILPSVFTTLVDTLPGWLSGLVVLLAAGSASPEPDGQASEESGSKSDFQFGEPPEPLTADWPTLILRQIPSFIWTTDRDLRITYIAGGDTRAFSERALNDFIGMSMYEVVRTDDPDVPAVRAHLQALQGRSTIYAFEMRSHEFDVRVEPLRDPDDGIIGCVALAVDVTGQHQVEKALRHVQNQLDVLVRERAAALAESNERLKQEIEERKRTEAQLRHSEKLYRGIVESQQDLVVRVDASGRFTFVNDAYLQKFGRSREQLIGTSFQPLVHPDDLRKTLEAMQGLQLPPYRVTMEQRALTVDGWRWIAWEDYALRDESGEIVEIQAVGRDITERKEVEQNEREQRALAEALRDIVSMLTSTLDLEEVLERILANIGRVVPHGAANVMLTDPSGHTRVVRARGYTKHHLHDIVMDIEFPLQSVMSFMRMARTRQPFLVSDTLEDPDWVHMRGGGWVRSYAGAPIVFEGELLGFVNLDSGQPNTFTVEDTERLKTFADQAAIAIRNARLHEQAQELAAVEAAMEERQRISRELHDAVSQSLFSASVIAQSLPRLWEIGADEVDGALNELNRLTRGALAEMRALLLELRPMDLVDVKLDDLLQQLVDAFAGKSSTSISLNIDGVHELTPEVRIALYRITQEALNNVQKHAHAGHASVTLHSTDRGTELRIADDGRGFDPAAVSPKSLGLEIMRERADLINATLEIKSEKGTGTEIVVKWEDPRKDNQEAP